MTNDNENRMRNEGTVDKLQPDCTVEVTLDEGIKIGEFVTYIKTTDKAFKLACKFLGANVTECPVGFHDNDGFGEHRDCDNICNNMDMKECWEAYFRWTVTG